ncbi:MAG: hypothetical protein LBI91_03245 [Spirochaetaceae bacterium]|jgi:hypothetical protein|nr:hypothetical protein [Spirochaetaceae bacterium]
MKGAAEIRTRTPPNLLPVKARVKSYTEHLSRFNLETLKKYYPVFLREKPRGNKEGMIREMAAAAIFDSEKAFREWFFEFPVLTQRLLYRLAFDAFVPVKKLEAEFGLPLIHNVSRYEWQQQWAFLGETNLDFLEVYIQYNQAYAGLPYIVQASLSEWLAPPPDLKLESCSADPGAGRTDPWDNSAGICDSLPLLYEAMEELFSLMAPPDSPYRCIRGFKKKDAEKLRASSALKAFNIPGKEIKASELVPDSVDLTARFILAMKNFSPARPKDGQTEVKQLVEAFFGENSRYKGYVNPSDRHSLELNVLFDHVSKGQEYSLNYGDELPFSRRILRFVLEYCAKDGGTFDADKITSFIYRTRQDFTFFPDGVERYIKFKAESITLDGLTYSGSYYEEFYPKGIMAYPLLVVPLFKAYCYLFAALGILEITQQMPPCPRVHNKKNHPLSPYDSLKTFRVTEFGKWCLDLVKKCPERPKAEYQAIADRELLLVTVQGTSLERTIYLDKIGRRLGPDRWRISPDSFIAGCVNKEQIEDRIAKFKLLIDPEPAPHWSALFEKAANRAGLFDKTVEDMLVYSLPPDQHLAEELLRDTEFRSLARRAEGGLLIVPEKNRKKFFAVLNKYGIAVFSAE